jgi:hypothetical protein
MKTRKRGVNDSAYIDRNPWSPEVTMPRESLNSIHFMLAADNP